MRTTSSSVNSGSAAYENSELAEGVVSRACFPRNPVAGSILDLDDSPLTTTRADFEPHCPLPASNEPPWNTEQYSTARSNIGTCADGRSTAPASLTDDDGAKPSVSSPPSRRRHMRFPHIRRPPPSRSHTAATSSAAHTATAAASHADISASDHSAAASAAASATAEEYTNLSQARIPPTSAGPAALVISSEK